MRLRPGRPDIARYADRFAVPEAGEGLAVTFLGVSSLLVDDGRSAFMTDGFFSRPGLLRVGVGRISPDERRIATALGRARPSSVAGIVSVHTHYDHALDTPTVAGRTGATMVGGRSAANIARGHGLPESQIRVVEDGTSVAFGNYDLALRATGHCPPDRFPGDIDEPVARAARAKAYRCGEAWSVHVTHRPTAHTALIQGSAGFVPGALNGWAAEVAYLGVGQLGPQPESYLERYWAETVAAVGARRAVMIHWDDFFRPLEKPIRAMRYLMDDLDVTMRVLGRLAARDGVELLLPTLWRRENPWG